MPTKVSDAELLAEWDALMQAVERPYAVAIAREKNRYITEAAETFKVTSGLVENQFDHHAAAMGVLADKYQGRAIRVAMMKALQGQKSRMQRKDAWDSLWLYLVRLWITQYGAARAKETAATTRADLQRIIDAALAPDVEFNPVAVATDMLKAKALSPFRAMTIARTEIHNAMMFAGQEGAKKLSRDTGVTMLKRWVPVLDERTRVNHAAMASHPPIPMESDFTVGGEAMQRPGDPRGSSANVVRCRCVLAYQVQD